MTELHVGPSDSHLHGRVVPEVTHFHFHRRPGDSDSVDGLSLVVRIADRSFTVVIHEGVEDHGRSLVQSEPIEAGNETFLSLIDGQHEEIAELQLELLAVAPKAMLVFDHARARTHEAAE